MAERLLIAGAPLGAYDAAAEALAQFPGDIRLQQILALALARSGASEAAIPLLEGLTRAGHADEETVGLLARVHKDLSSRAHGTERQRHLQLAYQYYREAYNLSDGIWSGINAATMALLLGHREEAAGLARDVRAQCLRDQAAEPDRAADYWLHATLGEAALILQDWTAAERSYRMAHEVGRTRYGDIASTRRNARLVVRELGTDTPRIEQWLPVPRVVAFSGHLIDAPGRSVPRFPPALDRRAHAAILERLKALDAGFGYSSAACGADILFLESLISLQAEINIVLPYNSAEFLRDSVAIDPQGDWPQRYRRMLAEAREVVVASEHRMAGGQLSYEYAALLLDGMAGIRADELDTELVPLVLWDRQPDGVRGGTASTVARWESAGRNVEVVDLSGLLQLHSPPGVPLLPVCVPDVPDSSGETAARTASAFEPQIVSLLFADARGFSGLTEDQIPLFVQHFLGAVAETIRSSPHQPLLENTWGDGLYLVFSSVEAAAQLALNLSEVIARTDWTRRELPQLSMRIALHAGPAYACKDPVTGRTNYLGAHVSRAAGLETITPPGQVYASRAFAALARANDVTSFSCGYIGRTPLPKGQGTLPVYVVRRRGGAS